MVFKIIGLGGFGTRVSSKLSSEGLRGVSFAAIDTDREELEDSELKETLKIGRNSPFGGGANG